MKKILCKLTAMFLACTLCVSQPGLINNSDFMLTAYAETTAAAGQEADSAAEDDTAAETADEGNGGSAGESYEAAAGEGDDAATATEPAAEPAVIWPLPSAEIQAGAAIVMDADTGVTLWGREIHTQHYPASVTKLLTALIVIENCDLDETVTFSSTAVSNLESGAVTIGAVAGDELSVRDCLYALLLKSANEVANALAEHVSGSVSEFAVLMNKRAEELGCQNSNFRNPSGLTDSEHVTSAYDMGLIGIACMNNPTFMELESEPTRKIGGTKNYPDGLKVTIGHKMRKSGEEYYDSRVVAGKTGYTSASGNTLVTMAEDNGRRIVAVVLKDKSPAHYTDTRSLLNFGLDSFENLRPTLTQLKNQKDLEKELISAGAIKKVDASTGENNSLSLSALPMITVPSGGDLSCADIHLKTKLPKNAPEDAVAQLYLSCQGHEGNSVYVLNEYTPPETESTQVEVKDGKNNTEKNQDGAGDVDAASNSEGRTGPGIVGWILIILLVTIIAFAGYMYLQKRAAEKRREERRRKRKERLERLESKNGQAQNADASGTQSGQAAVGGGDAANGSVNGRENGNGNVSGAGDRQTNGQASGTGNSAGVGQAAGNAGGNSAGAGLTAGNGQTARTRRHSRIRNLDAVHSEEELALLDSLSGKDCGADAGQNRAQNQGQNQGQNRAQADNAQPVRNSQQGENSGE